MTGSMSVIREPKKTHDQHKLSKNMQNCLKIRDSTIVSLKLGLQRTLLRKNGNFVSKLKIGFGRYVAEATWYKNMWFCPYAYLQNMPIY